MPDNSRVGVILVMAWIAVFLACGERSPDPLFRQLRSRDEAERTKASFALLRYGNSIVPRLIEEYGSDYTRVRFEVVQLLGRIKDPRAVPLLSEALDDPSASVAGAAAWALGEIRDPKALPYLIRYADDASRKVRQYVVFALGPCHSYAIYPELSDSAYKHVLNALRDDGVKVRIAALQSMREFGYRGVADELIRMSRDSAPEVRHVAVQALGQLATAGASSSVEALTPQLRKNVVEALTVALHDSKYQSIRTKAVRALGAVGAVRSSGALRRLHETGTAEDRRETGRVLEQWEGIVTVE